MTLYVLDLDRHDFALATLTGFHPTATFPPKSFHAFQNQNRYLFLFLDLLIKLKNNLVNIQIA